MRNIEWALKKCFWNWLMVRKFSANKPRQIPKPSRDARPIQRIPLAQNHPSVPVQNILVADYIPRDEKVWRNLKFTEFQYWLYRHFPPMVRGLPSIDPDPMTAIDFAYGPAHRTCLPAPVLPEEYKAPIDLGSLAVAGPYFCYLRHREDGFYEWDLQELNYYEYHPGLRKLGVQVLFKADKSTRRLKAVEIDCELGRCAPGDPEWELAQKIALCGAATHLSLVRHFCGIHLALVAQFAIATRNKLPSTHCLRRLLWAHVWGTQYSNELVTNIMMGKGGDFEAIFSFTHKGLCDLLASSYDQYDIRVLDPFTDAKDQEIYNSEFDLPTLENRRAHWNVINSHAHRYLRLYYDSDQELREDTAIKAWINDLNHYVPNGVYKLLDDKLTIEGVARLVTAYIYAGTVEHEAIGTGLWNYQLWTHVQPVRVYKNGRREPVDLYQRLVNYNFILNVSRAPLLQDLSYLAGNDRAGAVAFSTFLAELADLQIRLKAEPDECWKLYPADLEVSVNS
jgi:hypothetical protein